MEEAQLNIFLGSQFWDFPEHGYWSEMKPMIRSQENSGWGFWIILGLSCLWCRAGDLRGGACLPWPIEQNALLSGPSSVLYIGGTHPLFNIYSLKMLFFFFDLLNKKLTYFSHPSCNHQSVLCVYELEFHVSILDSTHKRDHMLFMFLCLTDFWLISLSIIPSRSIHVVAHGRMCNNTHFLWLNNILICVPWFLYLSINGHLSYFHILNTMHKTYRIFSFPRIETPLLLTFTIHSFPFSQI